MTPKVIHVIRNFMLTKAPGSSTSTSDSLGKCLKCGRCDVGEKYVCKGGPVFTLANLDKLYRQD